MKNKKIKIHAVREQGKMESTTLSRNQTLV